MSEKIEISIPKFNEELAEFVGIMLGDGNISINRHNRAQVTIVVNSKTELKFLNDFLKPLVVKLFSITPKIRSLKNQNALRLLLQISFKNNNSRLLRDFRIALINLGFNPSKVFGNRVVLTRQKDVEKFFKEIGTNRLGISQ